MNPLSALRENAELALAALLPYLNEGSTRRVYHFEGWVYKINNNAGFDDNALEWSSIQQARNAAMPDGFAIPETYYFDDIGVIVMRRIVGWPKGACWCTVDEYCMPDCLSDDESRAIRDFFPDYDTCYGNIVEADGINWLIDWG